jgi:hypothetical protein
VALGLAKHWGVIAVRRVELIVALGVLLRLFRGNKQQCAS